MTREGISVRRLALGVSAAAFLLSSLWLASGAQASHIYSTRAEQALEALITTTSQCCSIGTLYTHGGVVLGAFPTVDGTAGQALTTNGAGVWSFTAVTAGAVPFSGISAGTNATAAMVIGTGASLAVSGSGTINATTLGGATFAAPGEIGGGTPAALTGTTITATSHIHSSTTAPAVSNTSANSCGTTAATIVGTDVAGKVTVGATAGTSCTITFTTQYTNAPACVATNETTANLSRATSTTTTVILAGTFVAGDVLAYMCLGRV